MPAVTTEEMLLERIAIGVEKLLDALAPKQEQPSKVTTKPAKAPAAAPGPGSGGRTPARRKAKG